MAGDKKGNWGGARTGAGRKTIFKNGGAVGQFSVSMSADAHALFLELGNGGLTRGVAQAALILIANRSTLCENGMWAGGAQYNEPGRAAGRVVNGMNVTVRNSPVAKPRGAAGGGDVKRKAVIGAPSTVTVAPNEPNILSLRERIARGLA